jgi:Fe-S-cluster containining protein
MQKITSTLHGYRRLLAEVDTWFASCLQAGGSSLTCHGGCSACCRALFDITLLDAWLLKEAFAGLPPGVQAQVLNRCQPRHVELLGRWPELNNPYLLNALPEEEWLSMPEEDQTPCPLLDESGYCLVYAARPLTCRLHGLPNIDVSGEDFEGTVCTLHAGNPWDLPEQVLRWRFREVFTREIDLFREFTRELTGEEGVYLDTFIPLALVADYSAVDWRKFT